MGDYSWYVDVILKLLRVAGDYVVDEVGIFSTCFLTRKVWHRIVQVITNRQDVQDYAAKICYEVWAAVCLISRPPQALLNPAAHETMVVVGAYVLGEFGHLIANDPNSRYFVRFGKYFLTI